MNNQEIKPIELLFAFISITLLIILFPLIEWLRVSNAPYWVNKFATGTLFGSIGAFAYAVLIDLIRKYKENILRVVEPNIWGRLTSVVRYLFIFTLGVTAWIVSWEGETGVFYGFGAFLGAFLMNAGAGEIIKTGR
ncbi:hypothetical protein [Methylobacter tundripaludum]|uniref:hypothetical protein n=1 Tax=Methylobacter tundripaludum TaxID=173365 RepID=UPI000CEAAE7D|nr:hypothetical protein [Methylobacter tundripaludum]